MSSSVVDQNNSYTSLNAEQISALIKRARLSKGFTQKELSCLAGINLRSLQRIENAKVVPRNYTLKQLAYHLDIVISNPMGTDAPIVGVSNARPKKMIMAFGMAMLMMVSVMAYISQSSSFPETTFEALVLLGGCLFAYLLFLLWVWR